MKCFVLMMAIMFCLTGCAREHFRVHVISQDGLAVSNATVHVKTMNKLILFGSDKEKDFSFYHATTETNGMADVSFSCVNGAFKWWVTADGYYDSDVGRDEFAAEYDGSIMTSTRVRLAEHDKEATVILYEKKKVTPKFLHFIRHASRLKMPWRNGRYGFDFKRFEWLPPFGHGEQADLYYVIDREDSNWVDECHAKGRMWKAFIPHTDEESYPGIQDVVGRIEFPTGGAYYIASEREHPVFKTTYTVQEEKFKSDSIPLCVDGRLLNHGEYMVIRSRVKKDLEGDVISANYICIIGPFIIQDKMSVGLSVYNDKKNDMSLEYDLSQNLAE